MSRRERQEKRDCLFSEEADSLMNDDSLSDRARRGFEESRLAGGSVWLSCVPLERLGLDMTRQSFRDAVSLRMGLPFSDPLPTICPSCGCHFHGEEEAVDHLLICKKKVVLSFIGMMLLSEYEKTI